MDRDPFYIDCKKDQEINHRSAGVMESWSDEKNISEHHWALRIIYRQQVGFVMAKI
jgi:hypothetical protein